MRSRKRKRPKNWCATEEQEPPCKRRKEDEECEQRGDIPDKRRSKKRLATTTEPSEEATNKRLRKRKRPKNWYATEEQEPPCKRRKQDDDYEQRGDIPNKRRSKKRLATTTEPSEEATNKRLRKRKRPKNWCATEEQEPPCKRRKQDDEYEQRGDIPNKRRSKKRLATTTEPSEEATNKRWKIDRAVLNRADTKRPFDQLRDIRRNEQAGGKKLKRQRFTDVSTTCADSTPGSSTASSILGSLTFHRMIGEGGYGKVLLASHATSRERLVVKVVKKMSLLEFEDSIFIERQILQVTSESPFFPHGYAAFQTPGHVFYVMEYLSGGNLSKLINTRAPCDIATTRFIAAEIFCGLRFLYQQRIIHRDLKPENILLDAAGHVKIADFGLAVMNAQEKITGYAGTIGYMAPEVIHNIPYDSAVDLFAFGVILYQLAIGCHPFDYGAESDMIERSVTCDDPSYPNWLHPGIWDILERLLCKIPRWRHKCFRRIKWHPFFHSINWKSLEAGKTAPPFILYNALSPDPMEDRMPVEELLNPPKPEISAKQQRKFMGFSYTSNRWHATPRR